MERAEVDNRESTGKDRSALEEAARRLTATVKSRQQLEAERERDGEPDSAEVPVGGLRHGRETTGRGEA